MERIFSQTVSGRPKTEVLEKLAAGAPTGCRLHFVEDKLSTLEAVARAAGFEAWQLYLGAHACACASHVLRRVSVRADARRAAADWGYNTREEQARAAASGGRIRVVDLPQLPALLGVASGR